MKAQFSNEDAEMAKVIEASLKTATGEAGSPTYEPLNPEQSIRESDIAVGLRNNGNTCYFNSLLQTYFAIPDFVEEVMKFKQPEEVKGESNREKKVKFCSQLVSEIQ